MYDKEKAYSAQEMANAYGMGWRAGFILALLPCLMVIFFLLALFT